MADPNAPGHTRRLLVVAVEGDGELRRAFRFLLESEGYDVDFCETGAQLLARALPDDDACLVLHERMTDGFGLDMIATLRQRQVRLPAILLASRPRPPLLRAAEAAGVRIVEKPVLDQTLTRVIRELLTA